MAQKHLNPGPATPEGPADNVISFRRPERPPKPPAVSICEAPLFVVGTVRVEKLLHGLEIGGPVSQAPPGEW